MKKKFLFPLLVLFLCGACNTEVFAEPSVKKLYWFIPDGMRAEPGLFNIYAWAQEGKLPNIKRMMDTGTYGYCKPVYPGHTPVNFATLLTGTYPEVHGVSDGPMHVEGKPLLKPSVAGFSSTAKKVEPIWLTLEKQGRKVGLLSVPGSTPPEITGGFTMVGRWGGWGANFYAVNFEDRGDGSRRYQRGRGNRLFFFGPPLALFPPSREAQNWESMPQTYAPAREAECQAWGSVINAYIYDSTDDSIVNYDRITFSFDKKSLIADLPEGRWSEWIPVTLTWNKLTVKTQFKIRVIKLDPDGFFRVRFLYDAINSSVVKPEYLADDLTENAGPLVEFVDNFPPQLVYYKEDKEVFLEEMEMSFFTHMRVTSHFLKTYSPDVFIDDTYSPNQMLTSRWWMGYIDPSSPRYQNIASQEREQLWQEVKQMYQRLDDIIGLYLDNAGADTVVAVCSDHGAVPLHTSVRLNNLFAKKGWLHYTVNPESGEPEIDWQKSTVIYLKFGNVYINPDGLHDKDGNWYRGSGKAYLKLRKAVSRELAALKDEAGKKPLVKIAVWEDAEKVFRLPHERVGDLIIANLPGYGWNEEVTEDGKLFSASLETGYKQAIIPGSTPAMWYPLMLAGPGVKQGHYLGDKPVEAVDVYPTLMKLIGAQIPSFVQGKALSGAFAEDFRK